jgi:conjugal transfer pilus assembly protein TraW
MRFSNTLFLLCLAANVQAKDLGVWGELWPVTEPDMLTTIHDKLSVMEENGGIQKANKAFRERVKAHTLRPTPVLGLSVTRKNSTHFINPSFVVKQDIADQNGRVFAHKGEVINPLEHVPFNETLYFIDGDNPEQVAWMSAQHPPTLMYKVILVNGNIQDATRALDTHIYFDQRGVLSRKFALTSVPSRVSLAPDGKQLQVDAIALQEDSQ